MGLTRVVGIIAGLLLFIPAFSVVYEVIMRGMFNSPTEWVVEISTYCVTIAGFLGMAVTFVANKHIKVDILLSHLSKRTNEILSVVHWYDFLRRRNDLRYRYGSHVAGTWYDRAYHAAYPVVDSAVFAAHRVWPHVPAFYPDIPGKPDETG